jgi:hypothetical protein
MKFCEFVFDTNLNGIFNPEHKTVYQVKIIIIIKRSKNLKKK